MIPVLLNLGLLPLSAVAVWRIQRVGLGRGLVELATLLCLPAVALVGTAVVALDVGPVFFGGLQALAWLLFVHAPVWLGVLAWRHRHWGPAAVAVVCVGVGVDAALIEPSRLEVREAEVVVPDLQDAVTVALVADIQTDSVGAHERRALQAVADASPDLVVFAGDTIQATESHRGALRDELAALLRDTLPPLALGAAAVEGDVDHGDWTRGFAGTGVHTATEPVERLALGAVDLVLLDLDTSRAPLTAPLDGGTAPVTVVVGHRPDFTLGWQDAGPDVVFLAGHTHGGQVRLPLVGPLVTFSAVPRSQAWGVTELPGGATLVVSAGVGLERSTAPRIRFFCPPEVWIVRLVPGSPPQ